jgi:hypothetical protein
MKIYKSLRDAQAKMLELDPDEFVVVCSRDELELFYEINRKEINRRQDKT